MRYAFSLVVPENTLATAKVEQRAKLIEGTITRALVQFLRGPHNQVFVVVQDELTQIVPAAGDQPLFGDGLIHDVPMSYEIQSPSAELTLVGWSPGTFYDHTVYFYFDVEPRGGDNAAAFLASLLAVPGQGMG